MPKKDFGSVFGTLSGSSYKRLHFIEQEKQRNISILVLDSLDGLHVIPYARTGNYVDTYCLENELINGGELNGFQIPFGIKDKLSAYKIEKNVNVLEENFYTKNIQKTYDYVYVHRSINFDKYKDISMDKKIRKLKSSVKDQGYIFILYDLAIEESDYYNYPKNQFLRKGQMLNYFDANWEILAIREDKTQTPHQANPYYPFEHVHKVGYIFAKKKKIESKYRYHYKFSSKLSVKYENIDNI